MRGEFYTEALMLYTAFIEEKPAVRVPSNYVGIAKAVAEKVGWHTQMLGKLFDFKVEHKPHNNKAMTALSGGLDSVYLMFDLLDKGYDVTAVHVEGLNKSSAKAEAERAKEIARLAGVKFKNVVFKAPKQAFPDNPFKNQLVLSIMLDIGIKQGCYRYATGSDWTTPLSEAVTGFTITDSIDVNREYWEGVQEHFPQAELLFIDNNTKKYDRLKYLYENHLQALENVSSCIAPLRFRNYWHKQNVGRYGAVLMDGRCGSCYKCCMEYILLVEAGLVPKHQDYYDHCWHILATSATAHRPDLFAESLPLEERVHNLKEYGS